MTTTRPEILALIPARGGSKGIPRKNVIPVAGRPLIAHTIRQAKCSRLITRVVVSTDDAEIADVAREWGAEVPFVRPAEYAQDLSPDVDVLRHALIWLEENEAYSPELLVHLRPTGPIRRVELIDKAIELMLRDPEADSLRSSCWPDQTPYKMWRIGPKGYMEPLVRVEGQPQAHSMPRQMLPEVLWQNGYVDVIRPLTILEKNSTCGEKVLPFVTTEPFFEIDYLDTIPAVEAALERLERGEPLTRDSVPRHPH
ncbi:MAG: acylneuraminate cytidylyltransferase family protein [Chloroflexi bacterium]|nr:acylneuraminate cytidylyltransferase family protein [Chloroflexota bacterium]